MPSAPGFSAISTAVAAHLRAAYPAGEDGIAAPAICHDWHAFTSATDERDRLLLLLYHIEPDQAWRAANLPARDPAGAVLKTPAAWQLSYLIAAGARDALRAQDLLQLAAMHLHRDPVVGPRDSIGDRVLACTPQPHSQEQMLSLWGNLGRPMQPSLVYRVLATLD